MPEATDASELGHQYTETYYSGSARADEDVYESMARDVAARRMQRIEKDLGRRGTVLDVGCSTGWLLAVAAERGWVATGVEVSESAAQAARAHPGVSVHTGTLETASIAPGSIDAVIASHVLEHVPDPVGFLQQVARVMSDDAVLVLALPNSQGFIHTAANLVHRLRGRYGRDRFSCSLYPPSHLYAFSPASLVRALSRAGLLATSITITGKGDPETYPMRTWKGAGRLAFAQQLLERAGRAFGRGSLLEVHARKLPA